MFWKVLGKTFEEKGWDRECWEWRLFKELSIRGHDRLKNRHDSVAEDEAESHIAYLPVRCSRFQLWVRSRMELLPWVWAQVWTSWSLNMTQSDVSRSSASDRYFFHLSITAKKKKKGSKMALKRGRQTSQGWYATATSVKLGETGDWDIFDMSAELTCWTTLLQCLSKLAVGSLSHLANLKTGKLSVTECFWHLLHWASRHANTVQTNSFIFWERRKLTVNQDWSVCLALR